MTTTLTGPTGNFHIESQGITITRDGTPVLTIPRLSIEAYGAHIPTTGIETLTADDQRLHVVFTTARPDLRIDLEVSATADGFACTWSAPPPAPALRLTFATSPDHAWYGMGERVVQSWPLDTSGVISDPFVPHDHCVDGTLNIGMPLWLCSNGVALLVTEDTGDLGVSLNHDGNGLFQIIQRVPHLPFGFFGTDDVPIEGTPPRLPMHILIGEHLPAVQQQALRYVGHPSEAPPLELFTHPIWTTWARYKMDITQPQVLAFADEIIAHGYPYSVLEIDDRWQSAYGDLAFDSAKFPDPKAMVDALHSKGFRVTLWVPPFFDRRSAGFREAAAQGFLLRHPETNEPALTLWWQGYGSVIDVSNPQALDWWLAGLRRLQHDYGIDGFKFDGGEGNFLPDHFSAAGPLDARTYADQYVAFVAQNFEWTEVRTGWRSQRHGLLFREWDKWSRWGIDNGLHAVLTQALTLGMIGYPFVLPDMIGGNAYNQEFPDDELVIRWTQLTALLPAMQFSLAPWDYASQTTAICQRYAALHVALRPVLEHAIAEACANGTPLVRPLFWHAPDDTATYAIDDQFLLGADLLAAPVVQPNQRQRAIYLPEGRWRDYWTRAEYHGPRWLADYPAPLETLPLFERV